MPNENAIDFVKRSVTLREWVAEHETVIGDRAAHAFGGHEKDDPRRMSISEDGLWNCHGCGAGGSIIDYEMERGKHTEPVRAAEEIAAVRGLQLPLGPGETEESRAERRAERAVRDTVLEVLRVSAEYYHKHLSADGRRYFLDRGLTAETLSVLRIGETPKDRFGLFQQVRAELGEVDREVLIQSGLFNSKSTAVRMKDFFCDRYILPFPGLNGPVFLSGRARRQVDGWKYCNQKNTDVVRMPLWNSEAVQREFGKDNRAPKPLLICEGLLDGILAWQELRGDYLVCAAATAGLRIADYPFLAALLINNPRTAVFCFDRERAGPGENGAYRSAIALLEKCRELAAANDKKKSEETEPFDLRIALLPKPPELDKVDLADFLSEQGADAGRRVLSSAVTLERYEKKLSRDSSRFFVTARGSTDGTFRPKWAADELQAEGFYLSSGETLYRYTGGVYREAAAAVQNEISDLLAERWTAARAEETFKKLSLDVKVEPNELNQRGLINLKNGILDLRSERPELSPHSPYRNSTLQFGAEFDPRADCPHICKFLEEIVADEDVVRLLEMVGYAMDTSTDFHKAFLLVGSGRNGKSTFLKLVEVLFRTENLCAVPLRELEESRWGTARLFGKSANVVGDLEISALRSAAIFKSVVAGDRIGAERKNRPHFEFSPSATQILSMNKLPSSFDRTDGFYRRLEIIEFPNQFSGQDAEPQTSLLARLTRESELNAFGTAAICAYLAAVARGGLTETDASRAAVETYKEENEPHLRFFKESLARGAEEDFLSIAEIYDEYQAWLESEFAAGRRPIAKKAMTKDLQDAFDLQEPSRRRKEGKQARGFRWLRWQEGYPEDE